MGGEEEEEEEKEDEEEEEEGGEELEKRRGLRRRDRQGQHRGAQPEQICSTEIVHKTSVADATYFQPVLGCWPYFVSSIRWRLATLQARGA